MSNWKVTGPPRFCEGVGIVYPVTKGGSRFDAAEEDELKALLAGWISVDERMPGKGQDVQVFCADTQEQMVAFLVGNGRFQFGTYPVNDQFSGVLICQPSHWKPLTPPPTN